MDIAQQKEQFSNAYLLAVAAAAGYTLARPSVDDDSVDWVIMAGGANGTPRRPRLDAQLKCSAQNIVKANSLRFPLELKNYNDLRHTDLFAPRILIVLTVPENPAEWLMQSEQEMALRRCAYWVSLRGMADTDNRKSVTVELPRRQIFTPAALQELMRRVNDRETL